MLISKFHTSIEPTIFDSISSLLSHFACLLSHSSNSRIHLGVFPKQNSYLLSYFVRLPSHFSKSRTHLSIFRRQNSDLLSHFACLPSHFNRSCTFLVFSVDKTVICLLILPNCPLISVIRAFTVSIAV
jgi:hypothetical protein